MHWHALARYESSGCIGQALVLKVAGREALFDLHALVAAAGSSLSADQGDLAALASDGVAALVESPASRAAALAALAARFVDGPGRPAPLSGARLLAPLLPRRIHAAASNYHEHAREMGTKLAERTELQPYFFMKADTAVVGPEDTVLIPSSSSKVDWEVELAAVIGTGGRHVAVEDALAHVAGYTILNDVSARDLNRRSDYPFTHDWFRGKSWDTFAPLGPWVVPAGCIDDPQDLRLQLSVNERLMQDDSSGAMIFSIAEQIAYLSSILTLQPGDVIATGTPTGVGMGMGIFLKPGDVMTASIGSIGTLRNPVAAAPSRAR